MEEFRVLSIEIGYCEILRLEFVRGWFYESMNHHDTWVLEETLLD